MSNEFKDLYNDFTETQKKNYELCMKYPILVPTDHWTGETWEDYMFESTELDNIPLGWKNAFGEQWASEVQELSYNCNIFSVAAYPTVETTMVTKPIDISFTIIPFRIAGIEIPAVPKRM